MNKRSLITIFILASSLYLQLGVPVVFAETSDEIKIKIDKRNSDIAILEKEIASYQKQINTLSSQSSSLQSTLKTLQLTKQKLEKNITLTQDKITAKNYDIQKLDLQISGKEGDINDSRRVIVKAFATINEIGAQSLPALVLGSKSISDSFGSVQELSSLQQGLYGKIDKLSQDKASLVTNKKSSEKAKADLLKLNNQLNNERALVVSTTNEQASILKETNQSESSYKSLLATKKEEALAFEREINSYEAQLKILIDPKLLPKMGTGVLSYPLDNIYVTQRYGMTDFSLSNRQYYSTGSHNGMDFRAPIGTPVKSARAGTITGVGNTDLIRGCKSYGKWVLVKHDNGVSTLYAHLSLPSVVVGQSVDVGETIAYSGSTGAATGPHLHFGVFASQGLKVLKLTRSQFPTVVKCVNSVIPVGKTLDPASYL